MDTAVAVADTIASSMTSPTANRLDLLSALECSTYSFLQPPKVLHNDALSLAKRYLDPLAKSTREAQIQRQHNARRKRKRGEEQREEKPLQLTEVYLEGLKIEQIWQQARRILDASRLEVERSLPTGGLEHTKNDLPIIDGRSGALNGKGVRFRDVEDSVSVGTEALDEESVKDQPNEEGDGLAEELDGSLPDGKHNIDDTEQDNLIDDDASMIDSSDDEDYSDGDGEEEPRDTYVQDKLGLNDGFFSIDDFNRQTEFLEQQDARGEDDGAASDEDDIDWGVDLLAQDNSRQEGQHQDRDENGGRSDASEEGPTFGNVDLNGPDISDEDDVVSEDGVDLEAMGGMENTNEIMYADFFEPPPRRASKPSRRRALPKTQPPPKPETEDDIQRTISAVRRDIFEDDLTPDEDEGGSKGQDARSSHQKRQAALTAEIRKLEAAAVAKRDWTLSGEARAADRPINSLLEEDLEFERAGKPIPVITQEVSEDIEALIKRRILAREFDEVIRRRPGNLATGGADVRRGRIELDDTKPQQSLAEIYENEHLKTADPSGYVDKRDEKLKREHAKIGQMWNDISSKLDSLSSWHYKPKPPSANINVVADVSKISLEDARPAAGGEVGGESMLAPQEVYKAGEARDKKAEVVTGSGLPVGREEMTRDEKTRRRRREKERIRKAGGIVPAKGGKEDSKKTKEKKGVIGDLKKGGVRVIGKKGEIRDIEGNAVKGPSVPGRGAGGFKL